jgi:hypothetical protein
MRRKLSAYQENMLARRNGDLQRLKLRLQVPIALSTLWLFFAEALESQHRQPLYNKTIPLDSKNTNNSLFEF